MIIEEPTIEDLLIFESQVRLGEFYEYLAIAVTGHLTPGRKARGEAIHLIVRYRRVRNPDPETMCARHRLSTTEDVPSLGNFCRSCLRQAWKMFNNPELGWERRVRTNTSKVD